MKAVLVLLGAVTANALLATNTCLIPDKYANSAVACTAASLRTGYSISGLCTSGYPNIPGQAYATTETTLAFGTAFDTLVAGVLGCRAPALSQAWTSGPWGVGAGIAGTNCPAQAAGGYPAPAAAQSSVKGVSITCAAGYYPSAGSEGTQFCHSRLGADAIYALSNNALTGWWQAAAGNNNPGTAGLANWDQSTLTCSQGCTIPAPICDATKAGANIWHANINAFGRGLVSPSTNGGAGSCTIRPQNTGTAAPDDGVIQVSLKSNPNIIYTGTCTANAVNTAAGTLTWTNSQDATAAAPNPGSAYGGSTGYYILEQAVGTTVAGTISEFPTITSQSQKDRANDLFGQWGGLVRTLDPFQTASTYYVTCTGCTTSDCAQKCVNYWRCEGLTIDASAVCYADHTTRIACPTHTNGHRCASSSKKGLLGLLGLLGLIPLLLCIVLLCCLLPLCLRRKKTEGDVHFATFDPAAAPIAGSIAPGTACYAPSIGAYPTAVY